MKRLLMLLLALMLCLPAAAQEAAETTVLGLMADGDYIHQYIAPNGQLLWFTAQEEYPPIKFEDVNFDGAEDIVVFVTMGASNFFAEFFVYDAAADTYVRAEHPAAEYGICNYQLYPQEGIVVSQASNGSAGALHDYCLFRWDGTDLKLIRRALSEELREWSFSGNQYTTTTYADVLHMTVRDYTTGEEGGTLLWEQVISLEETEYRDIFTEEQDALWQGLK